MKMKQLAILTSMVAFGLTGCADLMGGKKPDQNAGTTPPPECTWNDGSAGAAPLWVCDAPVEGVSISAVGQRQRSAAGPQFMKDMAAASARVTLAQQMKVKVTNMIKQFASTTGQGNTETLDKVDESVSKLITAETIEGSRIFRSITSPNGTMYVLVGMDPTVTKAATEKVLQTSMNNDRALWQQFRAKKSQDELAEEIAKMTAEQAR